MLEVTTGVRYRGGGLKGVSLLIELLFDIVYQVSFSSERIHIREHLQQVYWDCLNLFVDQSHF